MKKEQLIFTLATVKVEVQLSVHMHALWSRTKFKTTKIFSCMFSFIYTKICTNVNFPLYGMCGCVGMWVGVGVSVWVKV